MNGASDPREGRVVCLQTWRRLLFLHWPMPASAVRPRVPRELDLDLAQGSAWITVVPFGIVGARVPHAPEALALGFLETNVRTYVRKGDGEPAVWFFSLEAGSRLAVWGARLRYGLPYVLAEMEERVDGSSVVYRTTRDDGVGLSTRYEVGAARGIAEPGTLDHFLVERYALHSRRGGRWWTVRVRHEPYRIRRATVDALEETLVAAAGLPAPGDDPARVHFVERVDVEIVETPREITRGAAPD